MYVYLTLQIDPSGDYKSIVTLKGFEPTFKLAGGINLPKILTCLGSDGRKRRQLVKVLSHNIHVHLQWHIV